MFLVACRLTLVVCYVFCPKIGRRWRGELSMIFCQSVSAVWVISTLIRSGDLETLTATLKFVLFALTWWNFQCLIFSLENCWMGRKSTSENYMSSNRGIRAMNFHGKRRSLVKLSKQNTFQISSCKGITQINPGNALFPACVTCHSLKYGILYVFTIHWTGIDFTIFMFVQ